MAKDRLAEVMQHWEAVIGLEIHTELTTREHQDVLRLPASRSAASPTPARARCASGCRARCRCPTRWPSSTRCSPGSRPSARSRAGASSIASSTSIPTCPRTTRSPSTTCRSARTASSTSRSTDAMASERIDLDAAPEGVSVLPDGAGYVDADRHHAHPPGRGHRQDDPRRRERRAHLGRDQVARRLQPRRHAAHRARERAGHPHARGGSPLRAEAAPHLALARHQRLLDGGGLDARRRQRERAQARARPSSAPRPRSRT